MRLGIAVGMLCLMWGGAAEGAVKTKTIEYMAGNTKCIGHLAWDDASKEKRPGVLVFHEWWGLNDYAKQRAEQLAAMGYIAFAGDLYGEGKVTTHPTEAREFATAARANVGEWRTKAKAAFDVLTKEAACDASKIAAIGYCFGGSTALQLSMSGAEVDAVVTFHSALPVPTEEEAKAMKGSILICHGAQDAFIPEETIQKFRGVLDKAGTDWSMIYFAGTKHSFTVKGVDEKNIPGMAYNQHADERSWQAMLSLFHEKFGDHDHEHH